MQQNKMKSKNQGQIRIISGKWRGRKLPVADSQGLRPTTDRTKETLYNWLMPYLHQDMRCLDLFAGSGGLAFEALSRGVAFAQLLEKESAIVKKLKEIQHILALDNTKMSVLNQDAIQYLKTSSSDKAFDLVFIDPPFNQGLLQPSIDALVHNNWLNKDAIVYLEHEISLVWSMPEQLVELKSRSTKQVCYRLLTLK